MKELFLELLHISLGSRDKLSRLPSSQEWSSLYAEAERQTVVGFLFTGLERLPEEQLPPLEVKLQWIGRVQMMEAEYCMHCERAVELSRRFHAVGFQSCVLKGVGMAQCYPIPSRRQCGDIDLWVNGRRKDVMAWMRSQCEIVHVTWHHVNATFFEDVVVEVHFHSSWLYNPFHYIKLRRFFEKEKGKQMRERGGGFGYPTQAFNAVYTLTHILRHLLEEGVGFRHVVDYYYVISSLSVEEREAASCIIREVGMSKILGAMMYVFMVACGASDDMLLCEPNEKEGKFFMEELFMAGNFGQTRQDGLNRNTLGRCLMMMMHYPSEVLWMFPFKARNKVWKVMARN